MLEFLVRPREFALPCRVLTRVRSATRSATRRPALRIEARVVATVELDQSAAEWSFSIRQPSRFSTIVARPTRGKPASRPASSVSNKRAGIHAEISQAGQILIRRVHDPFDVADGGSDGREVGAADRVDEQDAGALAPQLDEIGAMSVAIARSPLGIDGERSGTCAQPFDRRQQAVFVVDHCRDAVS